MLFKYQLYQVLIIIGDIVSHCLSLYMLMLSRWPGLLYILLDTVLVVNLIGSLLSNFFFRYNRFQGISQHGSKRAMRLC